MKPVLVTGASGFIGWHVARKLIERGHSVRALTRPGSQVRELSVETVTGDLRDRASLDALRDHIYEKTPMDLVEEARTVVAQRGFEANSKIITTSDQMLQALIAMKQ